MNTHNWTSGNIVRSETDGCVGMILGSYRTGHQYDRYQVFEVMTSQGIVQVEDSDIDMGTWKLIINNVKLEGEKND